MSSGEEGVRVPADLIFLANPAFNGLGTWEFLDYLKRSRASVQLKTTSGEWEDAPGPAIVTVQAEEDFATGGAYEFGKAVTHFFTRFRPDGPAGRPTAHYLATHAHGHIDYHISHRARVEDGEVVLERVEGAWNDTPFWIISASSDVCANHGDLSNVRFGELVEVVMDLNRVYEVGLETWICANRDKLPSGEFGGSSGSCDPTEAAL